MGVSATPRKLRGTVEQAAPGEIWIAELGTANRVRLGTSGDYRSPVFEAGGATLLALRDDTIVRVTLSNSAETVLGKLERSIKLVGSSLDSPDEVLVLTSGEDGAPSVGLLSLKTWELRNMPYDRNSAEDTRLVSHLLGWDRDYGDTRVFVESRTHLSPEGPRTFTDVFLKNAEGEPVNISRCEGANCSQPSLAPNLARVAYIRSAP